MSSTASFISTLSPDSQYVLPSPSSCSKLASQLSHIHTLVAQTQLSLIDCNEKSSILKHSNQQIVLENKELKKKILELESRHKINYENNETAEISFGTQPTDWFLAKENEYSLESFSSADSLEVLKEQVDNIKDLKESGKAEVAFHYPSKSIMSACSFQSIFKCIKKQISLDYGSQEVRKSKSMRFLKDIAAAGIPAVRF